MKTITPKRKRELDELFNALSVAAEGTYVYICDMKYDCSRWTRSAVDYFGLPGEYMYNAGAIWEDHIHPDDRENFHRSIDAVFSGTDAGHDMQYRARDLRGNYVMCTCRGLVLHGRDGNPEYFGGVIRNHGIQGHMNILTGLRNQHGFMKDMGIYLFEQKKFNVIMIGFANFSTINTSYGYDFGNLVLQKFGRLILEEIGNGGSVYKLDGSRFAVLSFTFSMEMLSKRFETVQNKMKEGFTVDGRQLSLLINGGAMTVGSFAVGDKTVYSCLNYAYTVSKMDKQGSLVIFRNELDEEKRNRIERINAVRNSIISDFRGFELYYQPIIDAKTSMLRGAEALLRWSSDEYGLVGPNDFIPIIENDAIFPRLGSWILRRAMMDGLSFLEKNPNFIMNVNLSYAQVKQLDFMDNVLSILHETGFPAENLCLEVTERCRLLDLRLLVNTVDGLRSRGIRFALDDFGTGFSSANILKELSFDTIKIDRAFVRNIDSDRRLQGLVEHLTSIAALYDSDVCVEGIENRSVRDVVTRFPVSSLQGYYYSKPVPVDAFMKDWVMETGPKIMR